jgi:hypothetical protein
VVRVLRQAHEYESHCCESVLRVRSSHSHSDSDSADDRWVWHSISTSAQRSSSHTHIRLRVLSSQNSLPVDSVSELSAPVTFNLFSLPASTSIDSDSRQHHTLLPQQLLTFSFLVPFSSFLPHMQSVPVRVQDQTRTLLSHEAVAYAEPSFVRESDVILAVCPDRLPVFCYYSQKTTKIMQQQVCTILHQLRHHWVRDGNGPSLTVM